MLQGENMFQTLLSTIRESWVGSTQKRQQVCLGGKEGEIISATRNTVIEDAENIRLAPILELTYWKRVNNGSSSFQPQ